MLVSAEMETTKYELVEIGGMRIFKELRARLG